MIATIAITLIAITAHATTRVALVTTCGGSDALALAEVKLGTEPGITLVDRTQAERILDEQKLSRCGRTSADHAMAMGKLLGVDVFAALETFPGSTNSAGLVAFDAHTGVRLVDVAVAVNNAEAGAAEVVTAVRDSCAKRNAPLGTRRTICLLAVRNADMRPALNGFCETVGLLLERGLVALPDLSVLERKRLEHINRERELPSDSPVQELMGALVIVDLDIGRGPDGKGFRATAHLSGNGVRSNDKISADVPQHDAGALAQALGRRLAECLSMPVPKTEPDRAAEAERFFREAAFLWSHWDFRAALPVAEAAFALAPQRPVIRGTLAAIAAALAGEVIRPSMNLPSTITSDEVQWSLELAQRAVTLLSEPLVAKPEPSPAELAEINTIRSWAQDRLTGYVNLLLGAVQIDPAAKNIHKWPPDPPQLLENAIHYGDFEKFNEHLLQCPASWRNAAVDQCILELAAAYRQLQHWPVPTPIVSTLPFEQQVLNFLRTGKGMDVGGVLGTLGRDVHSDQQPAERLKLLDEMFRIMDSPDCGLTADQKAYLQRRCSYFKYVLLRYHPDFGLKTTTPWIEARTLIDILGRQSGPIRFVALTVQSNAVWIVARRYDGGVHPFHLQLIRSNWRDGGFEELGKCEVSTMEGAGGSEQWPTPPGQWRLGVYCTVDQNNCYVSTAQGGIIRLPMSAAPGERIIASEDVPGNLVSALAVMDDKLYYAVSPKGYIFVHDLKTKQTKLLASSIRREKLSELDDCPPFSVMSMQPDPDRQRLVVATTSFDSHQSSVWEYAPVTKAFRRLAEVPPGLEWRNTLLDGRMFFARGDRVMLFDPRMDKLVSCPTKGAGEIYSPFLIDDDWFWTSSPWGRRSLDGKQTELFPPLRGPDKVDRLNTTSSRYYYPCEYLSYIDNRHILAADQYGVWVLALPDKPAKELR